MEIDLVNRRLLFFECILGVFAPIIGGGDNDALSKGLASGGGEEAVDVGLSHAIIWRVAFALDGVVFLGAMGPGNEVDTGILSGYAELRGSDFPGPISKEPYFAVQVGVTGFIPKISADEFLEISAFFPLGL